MASKSETASLYEMLLESRDGLKDAADRLRVQEEQLHAARETEIALRAAIALYKRGLDPVELVRESQRLRKQVTSLQRANTEEVERKRMVSTKLCELRAADERLLHFVNTAILDLIQGVKSPAQVVKDLRLGLEYPPEEEQCENPQAQEES